MDGLPWWRMRFSYRNATIVVCFLNVVAATFLLRGFFSFADKRIARANQPNLAQMRYIMESEQIRRSMEPLDLIKRIKEIEEEALTEPGMETKQVPKQTAAVDLSKRLNDLRAMNDANSLKALEEWRKRKMERARQRQIERNTTITSQT
ncbi:hypothetical protein IEQ34_008806 [Dendrobium chrysotoxum]|uniref:Transmembrane protein n=1 Tax=Dendrobium chrysotoxum TaxID=161865 RepID=A0AAV7GX01_DENCH|nr:hypothetical protein IEQ34_008806 [Dendrobium chrysotoxum]